MTDQEERPVPTVPSRLAGVLSDERRAECLASGTLRFDLGLRSSLVLKVARIRGLSWANGCRHGGMSCH